MNQNQVGDIIGFDHGEARIGVARVNTIARIPEPLEVLENNDNIWVRINEIINEHRPIKLVVGLPRNMSGEETKQSKLCREFSEALRQKTDLEVVMQDESLTSVRAEEMLNTAKQYTPTDVDMLAAAVILKDYLGDTQ